MTDDTRPCRVCGEIVPVDGENAIERWGGVLCRDCSDKSVVFGATCTSELCDWSFRAEDDEFNRGHVKIRAQQEANHHQKQKEVFEDNPMHKTKVEEVSLDGETE